MKAGVVLFQRDVAANIAARVLTLGISVVLLPIYVHVLGVEAYGIVGLHATIVTCAGLLDAGISRSFARELARLSVQPNSAPQVRNVFWTLELVYCGAAFAIGIGIAIAAPLFAAYWLHSTAISRETIQRAMTLLGIAVLAQLPVTFYSNGLLGLQRQVVLNAINVAFVIIRALLTVVVLWFFSPTLEGYLLAQIAVSAINVVWVRSTLERYLPISEQRGRFDRRVIAEMWGFIVAAGGAGLMFLLLVNIDRLILSHLLPLSVFGYYSISATASAALLSLVSPVRNAVFPHQSQLVELKRYGDVASLDRQAVQIICLVFLPIAVTIVALPQELMLAWTGNIEIATQSAPIIRVLVVGSTLLALAWMSYGTGLAFGYVRRPFWAGVAANTMLVALLPVGVALGGALGAAVSWSLAGGLLLILLLVTQQDHGVATKARQYCYPLIFPAGMATVVSLGLRSVWPTQPQGRVAMLLSLALFYVVVLIAVGAVIPWVRHGAMRVIPRVRRASTGRIAHVTGGKCRCEE